MSETVTLTDAPFESTKGKNFPQTIFGTAIR